MSTDLTFITNESGKSLHDRFGVLLGDDTPFRLSRRLLFYQRLPQTSCAHEHGEDSDFHRHQDRWGDLRFDPDRKKAAGVRLPGTPRQI